MWNVKSAEWNEGVLRTIQKAPGLARHDAGAVCQEIRPFCTLNSLDK